MRMIGRLVVMAMVATGLGCATTSGDARIERKVRSYDHSQMGFSPLYRAVLLASLEALQQDLGARIEQSTFDPLRPPAALERERANDWIDARIPDLEQLGDVELRVRVSAPRVMDVENELSTVEVGLTIRTSADPTLDPAVAEDRAFVERSFWESLDARLEDRVGIGLQAGRIRSGI